MHTTRHHEHSALETRVATGTLNDFNTLLATQSLYGTGAVQRLLSDPDSVEREAKIMRLAAHHVAVGHRPSAAEGAGAPPHGDRKAEGEPVGDPLLHHAALSQQITGTIATSIAAMLTSAHEEPQANARRAGAWGLVTTDYLRPRPLECDPEPATLATAIAAMGGWPAIDACTDLAASATSALLREGAAHGHLDGVQRARARGHTTAWIAQSIELSAHDGALCRQFLDRMVEHEPALLVAMLETPDRERASERTLAQRIARDVRAPRGDPGALEGAALREAVGAAHSEARLRIGHGAIRAPARYAAPAWAH